MGKANSSTLRFGIISADTSLAAWQLECVRQLLALPDIVLSVRVVPGATPRTDRDGIFRRLCGWPDLANPQTAPLQQDVLEGLPVLPMSSSLERANLDFILCFADSAAIGNPEGLTRYGIWAFSLGDWETYRGGPGGFWEIYDGASTTSAMLVQLLEDPDSVVVLRRGRLRTKRISFRQNSRHVLSRITHWPAQACIDIRNGEFGRNFQRLRSSARIRSNPSTLQLLVFGARTLRFAAVSALRNLLQFDQWNVGIVRQPIRSFLDSSGVRAPVEWLPARPHHEYIADPFGVYHAGKLTIVCEYLNYRDGVGVITAVTDPNTRALTPVHIGPGNPVHMSFPFLIEHDGRVLCIPETHQAAEVVLYEAERFPDRWRKVATLLSGTALADVTVFRYEDRWWLAGADTGLESPSADLFLWHAESIEGPWRAHANNPVKTDVCSARPAGTPFHIDGVLYRPVMDCAESYGGRVHINRVDTLTPTAFPEETVATVEPDERGPYPEGVHTLSAVGDVTLIDGKRSVFVQEEFRRVMMGLFHRLAKRR
jgi:hypothetical protein